MMLANAAYQAGQIVGVAILVLIAFGLIRTFAREDLSWREKILGRRKR